VIVSCALVAMIDGFDTQAIGLVAPDIAADLGVNAATFGLVFGIGLSVGLIGAFLFGLTSDRYGRRPNLLVAVGLFGVITLLTPLVDSVPELMAVRFVTGLGLGGALPGIIALTSEYTPARMRTTVVGLMFCGFPLGAVLGGLVAARLIRYWLAGRVLRRWGGCRCCCCRARAAAARVGAVPGHGGRPRRAGPDPASDGQPGASEDIQRSPRDALRVSSLFTEGRAAGTLLIWLVMFLSLLLAYLLVNWIPIVAGRPASARPVRSSASPRSTSAASSAASPSAVSPIGRAGHPRARGGVRPRRRGHRGDRPVRRLGRHATGGLLRGRLLSTASDAVHAWPLS